MYSNILFATDLKEDHFALCQQAAAIAKAFKGQLSLLHVIEAPASLQLAQGLGFAELINPVKDDAQTVMSALGDALNIPLKRQYVEGGSIKTVILQKVKELHIDLIIIGSHSPNHLPAFLGSTANAIVHHANCDVLTLRG